MAKVPANFNGVLNKKGAVKKYLINFLVIFIAGFIFGYIAETLYFYNL
ncbi:MAG: hypothetical protein HYT36_00060 [Candidatus Staskawiczbacteria bacterium]|nr:hypothetical protein [Candidatus Staskawiczbacteria bacterium]